MKIEWVESLENAPKGDYREVAFVGINLRDFAKKVDAGDLLAGSNSLGAYLGIAGRVDGYGIKFVAPEPLIDVGFHVLADPSNAEKAIEAVNALISSCGFQVSVQLI